jgi:hypothetical protein
MLACVHFITDSTRVSDILRFIIHTQHLNDKFTKFDHQRTPDAPSKLRKIEIGNPIRVGINKMRFIQTRSDA